MERLRKAQENASDRERVGIEVEENFEYSDVEVDLYSMEQQDF